MIVLCNDVNFVGTSRIGWTSKLFSYHVAALLDASLGTDVNQINEWKLELKFWSRVTCPELKPLVHRNSYATIHVYAVELVKHMQSFFSVENTWVYDKFNSNHIEMIWIYLPSKLFTDCYKIYYICWIRISDQNIYFKGQISTSRLPAFPNFFHSPDPTTR